jgi:hypothetical protein
MICRARIFNLRRVHFLGFYVKIHGAESRLIDGTEFSTITANRAAELTNGNFAMNVLFFETKRFKVRGCGGFPQAD